MPAVIRYLISIALTCVALALALFGRGIWGASASYSFLLGAVMLSSWLGGLGPGLVTTVLGTVAADYFLIPPIYTITFDSSRLIQLSTFVAISVLINSLNVARRRALESLAAEGARLDQRVTERTAELAAANESLRAEIERRSQSERNFRGLIDAAPDAILVIDSDGRVIKMNAEAERMFGYDRRALLGQDVERIIPERFRSAHHSKRHGYGTAPATKTISGQLAGKRADGSEFPVEIRISPLDAQGARSIVGIVRDITERQRLQDVQQRLVHDLGERVKELTALHVTGRLLNEPGAAHDVLARMVTTLPDAWQYPDITEARITIGDIDVRTDRFERTQWLQRAAFRTSDGETGAIEVVYRENRPVAAEGPFLAEERNLIESLAGMLHAYFDRLHAEENRLSLARAEAERLQARKDNEAKDQFLATLSHELRSPLTVMLGWTQMLRSGHMSPDAASRGFDVLERSVRLQAKLIDDLLDVSRIIAGKLRMEKGRVDVSGVASAAVDSARPMAHAKNVRLAATIEPRLFVDGDPQRLQQVISNLLNNALKFTPEDGSIQLTVERAADGVRLTVQDTGIGIAVELLPRVFDRFQQGDGSTTRSHGGLGLGLAIVKYLVEQHGGQIAVESDGTGCGARFTVTLPALVDALSVVAAPQSVALDPSLLAGVRVLVVDDEADARATLRAIFEEFGAEPTVVSSARDALDAIARHVPDVVVSDVAMPNESGYALMRQIRLTLDSGRLPAAALSAYVDGDSKTHALEAGFQTYLSKPVEPMLLATTVATLVHRSEAAS